MSGKRHNYQNFIMKTPLEKMLKMGFGVLLVMAIIFTTELKSSSVATTTFRPVPNFYEICGAAPEDSLTKAQEQQRLALLDSIHAYICGSEIVHKEIVFRQVLWETNFLKNDFLMSRNNLFGFRAKKYLVFGNWQESIDYYLKWQKKRYTNPDEDYYKFLVRVKYASHRYPAHLKSVKLEKTCNE